MLGKISSILCWENKINFSKTYTYDCGPGAWVHVDADLSDLVHEQAPRAKPNYVNYGCGSHLLEGWLNVDGFESDVEGYQQINLLEKHPFDDDSILFGFSEDMLEHLTQAESIYFLSEIYRTLVTDGVMRMSFPGFEGGGAKALSASERHKNPGR